MYESVGRSERGILLRRGRAWLLLRADLSQPAPQSEFFTAAADNVTTISFNALACARWGWSVLPHTRAGRNPGPAGYANGRPLAKPLLPASSRNRHDFSSRRPIAKLIGFGSRDLVSRRVHLLHRSVELRLPAGEIRPTPGHAVRRQCLPPAVPRARVGDVCRVQRSAASSIAARLLPRSPIPWLIPSFRPRYAISFSETRLLRLPIASRSAPFQPYQPRASHGRG